MRSSGIRAIPARIASCTLRISILFPRIHISPVWSFPRSAPNTVRANSVRPEPTSPETQSTSPAWSVRLMFLSTPGRFRFLTSRIGSPRPTNSFGYSFSSSRPTIIAISRLRSSSRISPVCMCCPSRSTVTRSEISKTSSIRCEM